jgi:hypothetical protein
MRVGDFMSPFGKCRLGAAITAALWLLTLPSVGHAYTAEQQQACQPDAFRLCGPEIPDVDRVTACMIARKSQLSPQCRQFFRAGPEPDDVTARPARPMNIKPATAHKPKAKKVAKPKTT